MTGGVEKYPKPSHSNMAGMENETVFLCLMEYSFGIANTSYQDKLQK